jgi:hypothetical protein
MIKLRVKVRVVRLTPLSKKNQSQSRRVTRTKARLPGLTLRTKMLSVKE